MRTVYEQRIADTREIERRIVQGTAKVCSGNFGKCWKALFPIKAAEELAARRKCSVRTAAYEISGEHRVSAESLHIINGLMLD